MVEQLYKLIELKERTRLSKSHIYDLAQRGLFPQPIQLSTRSSAWIKSEVDDWIAARIAERDGRVSK